MHKNKCQILMRYQNWYALTHKVKIVILRGQNPSQGKMTSVILSDAKKCPEAGLFLCPHL